ncbi:alpha/beta-hydrolase, partial [Aureobasidium melanogenum]
MSRWICIRARQDHGSLSCTNKTREKIELFFSQTELLFAFPHLTNVHNVLSNDAKEVATQPNGSNPSSLFFFCAHSVSPLKNTTTPPLPDTLAVILNNGAPVAGRGLAVAVREVQWRKQSWQFVHISSFILQSQSIALGSRISTTCTRRLFLQRKLLGSARDQVPMSKHRRHSVLLIISARFRRRIMYIPARNGGSHFWQPNTIYQTFVWSSGFLFAVASLLRLDVRIRGCQCRCGFLQAKDRFEMFNIRDVQSFDCLNHLLHLLDIVVGLVDVHLQASSSSLSRFAILSASVSAGTTFDVMSPAVLVSNFVVPPVASTILPSIAFGNSNPGAAARTSSTVRYFVFLLPPPTPPALSSFLFSFLLFLALRSSSLESSADTCTLWSQFDFDGVDNALALLSQSLTLLFGALAAVVVGAEFAFALEACALHLVAREDRPCQDSAILMERLALKGDSVVGWLCESVVEAVPLVGLGVAVAVNTPVSATVLVPLLPLCNSTARRAVLFRVRIPYACCHNALALFHVTDLLRRASVLHCSDPTSRCWLLGQWRVCISAIDDTSEDGKGSLRLIEWHHVSRVVDSAEREIAKLAHSTSDITRVNDDIRIACTVPAREQKKRPRHLSSCTSKETYNVVSIAIHQRNTHSRTEEVGNVLDLTATN